MVARRQAAHARRDVRDGSTLRATYEALGARVLVKPAAKGWPDLVFTANCAVVLDGKAILARYLKSERAGEELHGQRMFEQLEGARRDRCDLPHARGRVFRRRRRRDLTEPGRDRNARVSGQLTAINAVRTWHGGSSPQCQYT